MKINSLYINLLKKSLSNYIYLGGDNEPPTYDWMKYYSDYKWSIPASCRPHTCLRIAQLDNLQDCILTVIDDDIPGDFIEAGVYKGGAVIFMTGLLQSLEITDRTVWVADSFSGIPVARNEEDKHDIVDDWDDRWEASFEEVQSNFRRYGLLSDQVKFLKGYFEKTLPKAKIEKIAIARLDGDSYESTMDALKSLYPKMSSGGYVIIDDWHVSVCRQAVFDYRESHNITSPIFYKKSMYGPTQFEGTFEAYWRVD